MTVQSIATVEETLMVPAAVTSAIAGATADTLAVQVIAVKRRNFFMGF
jgi:hypothetical protein